MIYTLAGGIKATFITDWVRIFSMFCDEQSDFLSIGRATVPLDSTSPKNANQRLQVHTVIIYILMLYSLFRVYVTSEVVGSPDRMWELLKEAAHLHPVEGNAHGEYLTMRSEGGGYIGLVFIGAGFAAAVDSQLFQKAIAADPRSTSKG